MRVAEAIAWLSSLPLDAEVDLAVRSVRMPGERTRRAKTSAERMRELRSRREPGDDPPSQIVTNGPNVTKCDDASDGQSARGLVGVLPPKSVEKLGKEKKTPESNLTGSDHKAPENVTASDASPSHLPRAGSAEGTAAERRQVAEVFEAWRQDTGHYKAILDRARGRKILARLRDGFTPARLILAITNRRNSRWLMGKDGSPKVYDDVETLLRDAKQVERLESLTEPEPARVNGNPAPARGTRAGDLIPLQLERIRELEEQEARQEAAQ